VGNITIDSPVPYKIDTVIQILKEKNIETKTNPSTGRQVQGDFNGKLSRFIQRLEAKVTDKRLNFMFSEDIALIDYDYMNLLCNRIMAPASCDGGIKIIDFSEVPSDILPLIVSLIARVIFSVQQWIDKDKINPISIFCDEAHLYIPANAKYGVEDSSLQSFERIAKEGRKYGVGLVVISQRPSEVNRTVLSQSSNYIAMRLTNADDQNVIKKLLPDSIGNFADLLPILDVGEAIVVGDASLIPNRIIIDKPVQEPNSATVKFWNEWSKDETSSGISEAVEYLRKQSKL
jgi:DNA helicase HerA-like ATPase